MVQDVDSICSTLIVNESTRSRQGPKSNQILLPYDIYEKVLMVRQGARGFRGLRGLVEQEEKRRMDACCGC